MVSFLHNFIENITVLKKYNVLLNNEEKNIDMIFLLIDNEFDLEITLRILNPENHQEYQWKSAECCYFRNHFQYPYRP